MTSLIIGIGSTNPTKVAAVEEAVTRAHKTLNTSDRIEFRPVEVESGVAAQPFSEEETRQGALNRAKAVLAADTVIERAFGLEGGVVETNDGLYSTVWICVMDRAGHHFCANGLRFRLPPEVADGIRAGQEMGAVMDRLHQTTNSKHGIGMIGMLTRGVVTRSQAYASLARLAYGLFLTDTLPTS